MFYGSVSGITELPPITGQPSVVTEETNAWVLLVTDGTVLEAAPEVFLDEGIARFFAENWAWFLSYAGEFRIERPFDGRLQVGHRDVRLVPATLPNPASNELWVGTHWTEDNLFPHPESILLPGWEAACAWAMAPLHESAPDEVTSSRWHVAATFRRGDEEAYSVAYAAKVIGRSSSVT